MKNKLLTAAVGLLTFGGLSAAPFMAVGTSAEVFVTADLTISVDDNVTLGSNVLQPGQTTPSNPVRDDTKWRFSPGVSYEFGKNALISGKLAYVEHIDTYSDNSDLDTSLSNLTFNALHDDGSSKTTVAAAYRQVNQNTVDIRLPSLSRRDVLSTKIDHEMELTAKSSVSFGVDWRDTDYSKNTLEDRTITTLPLRYYWETSPKVDLSFGGSYRSNQGETANSSSDDFLLNLGARGEFTAKLSGFLRVGFVNRSLDSGSDRNALNMSSNLTYQYSEKTSFTAGMGNDFGNSGAGENQENFDVFLGFRSEMTPEFAMTGRISLRQIDYFTRAGDEFTQASLGGEYIVNEYFQLHGKFAYQDNASGLAGGDFDATVFSLMAKLRY